MVQILKRIQRCWGRHTSHTPNVPLHNERRTGSRYRLAPTVPALGRLKQENHSGSEADLPYMVRSELQSENLCRGV